MLGRPPEHEGVVRHYAAMQLQPHEFARVLMDSEEVLERYRRRLAVGGMTAAGSAWPVQPHSRQVLLFGAYGNGNLGDSAQAESMGWLLRRLLPQSVNLAATSWERRAPYEFACGTVLPADALLRAGLLPRGGSGAAPLVAIGGGGLFGTPHFPLSIAEWAQWFARQEVPWALVGVGGSAAAMAEPHVREAYGLLLGGAVFVGVRDPETLEATRRLNPRACWFPDPVLIHSLLEPVAPHGDRPIDVLLIPRRANGPVDAAANAALLAWRERLQAQGRRVAVAAMERTLDAPMLKGLEVDYPKQWEALVALCRQCRVVVSMRLHGVVAALAGGCVTHGLVQPKIGDLMRGLAIGDWFHESFPDPPPALDAAAASAFRAALEPGLRAWRPATQAALRQAAAALGGAG